MFLILLLHPLIDSSTGDITKSKRNGFLDIVAQVHAEDMAKRRHQDHNGFLERAEVVKRIIGCTEVSEICAEGSAGQSMQQACDQAWKDWRQSRSHWKTANGKPKFYGVGMSKSDVWYFTIIATW